jgi:hypothetical protein
MLNNGKNILPDLKDHEVQPPSFLLDKIMQKIEEEEDAAFKKVFAPLAGHSISPKQDLFIERIAPEILLIDKSKDALKALKDHQVAPPVKFEEMLASAKKSSKASKVFNLGDYSRRIAAAVVVIILGAASYFIYQNKQRNGTLNGTGNTVAVNDNLPANKPSSANTLPGVSSGELAKEKDETAIASNGLLHNPQKAKSELSTPFYTGRTTRGIAIDGSQFPVKNNDYLGTFASFTEASIPPFLRAEKPVATTVTIDKYTSITVSEGMAAILKKSYKTRRNGKPTRRARKQKEKIEKWKKADADYFNQNSTNNPLDPMDLGDFILYR